ncbi:MAG: hypothetical protein A4E55_00296 [Pelotomaculum sp. PtaU1.Bin035]|nr:MAG: hypothetical protein A4E55_00296 [Pelotomaculum sp. PtaU1.Bin035]
MRINYPQVLRQANQIEDLGGELKDIGKSINVMMQEIPQVWRGEAAQAYLKVCEELQQGINKTSKNIVSVSQQIRRVAKRIHEEDEKNARAAKNLL